MPARRGAALAVALLLALGTSCGDDGDGEGAGGAAGTTSSTTTAASTMTAPGAGLSEASPLRLDGIGPVRIGMTPEEASAALGRSVTVNPDTMSEPEASALCGYTRIEGGPEDLSFMVTRTKPSEPWRINRIDVHDASRIATEAGIRIGATEADVRRAYGRAPGELVVEGHEYLVGGSYMVYDADGPAGHLLLFETDGTRVLQFRSGRQEEVGYTEGCA